MTRFSLTFSCSKLYEEAFSKSDPYIVLSQNGVRVGRTETVSNSKSPHFQRAIEVNANPSQQILLQVYDDDFGVSADDFLGECVFDLGMLQRDYDKKIQIKLRRFGKETKQSVTIYGKEIADSKPAATSYTSGAAAPAPTSTHIYVQQAPAYAPPQQQPQTYAAAPPAYGYAQQQPPPPVQYTSYAAAPPPPQYAAPHQQQYAPQPPPAQPYYPTQQPQYAPPPQQYAPPQQHAPPQSGSYGGVQAGYPPQQQYAQPPPPQQSYAQPPQQQYAQAPPQQQYAQHPPAQPQYAQQPQQGYYPPPQGYAQQQPGVAMAYPAAPSAPPGGYVPGTGQAVLQGALTGQW